MGKNLKESINHASSSETQPLSKASPSETEVKEESPKDTISDLKNYQAETQTIIKESDKDMFVEPKSTSTEVKDVAKANLIQTPKSNEGKTTDISAKSYPTPIEQPSIKAGLNQTLVELKSSSTEVSEVAEAKHKQTNENNKGNTTEIPAKSSTSSQEP